MYRTYGILKLQEHILGYVQDERYGAVPRMAKSGNVQDERYGAVPGQITASCVICIPTIHGGHGKERFLANNGHISPLSLCRLFQANMVRGSKNNKEEAKDEAPFFLHIFIATNISIWIRSAVIA